MDTGPLLLHFVWIGKRLPYYCRLAIESAFVAMPQAAIELHALGIDGDSPEVFELANTIPTLRISRIEVPELLETCPAGVRPFTELFRRAGEAISPAALSNVLRLAILHRDGGVYLDTDVVVVRPLHDPRDGATYVGCEQVWGLNRQRVEGRLGPVEAMRGIPWALSWIADRSESRVCHGRLWATMRPVRRPDDEASAAITRSMRLQVNNAVVGAPAGAEFLRAALDLALDVNPCVRYALGPSLLDDVARRRPETVRVEQPSTFYPVPPGRSHRIFEDRRLALPSDTRLVHYVASNHRRLLATVDADDPRFDLRSALFWRLGAAVHRSLRRRGTTAGVTRGNLVGAR